MGVFEEMVGSLEELQFTKWGGDPRQPKATIGIMDGGEEIPLNVVRPYGMEILLRDTWI